MFNIFLRVYVQQFVFINSIFLQKDHLYVLYLNSFCYVDEGIPFDEEKLPCETCFEEVPLG